MDVDGTLTDGKIYMGVDGESLKAFDIKDGYALHTLLKEHGIIPVIITARKSLMVEHRCKELGVTEIHQGVMKKLDCLRDILKKYSSAGQIYDFSNTAYIGDDILDMQCMIPIKQAGGIIGCPANACKEVLSICDYVSPFNGGDGAVRSFVEHLISFRPEKKDLCIVTKYRLEEAVRYIQSLESEKLDIGKYVVDDSFYYTVQEYVPTSEWMTPLESHRCYIDIQLIVSGSEWMLLKDASHLVSQDSYNEDSDVQHYEDDGCCSMAELKARSLMVIRPGMAHKVIQLPGNDAKVKKIVGKLKVQER